MPWSELALNTLALLVYPGLLACLLLGLVAEAVAARALRGEPGPASALWPPQRLRERAPAPPAAGAALLTLLAAAQLALPFSPMPATERNLLVAAVALLSAGWLAWGRGRASAQQLPDTRLVLVAQACWLVALLAPALVAQSLLPQVLGATLLLGQLPLKLVAAALFLICLPVLLQLLPEASPASGGFRSVRTLLWLPLCGLFASVFMPPGAGEAPELLRFAAATVGSAAAAILIAMALTRWGLLPARRLYLRVALPLALLAVGLAALAELVPQAVQ